MRKFFLYGRLTRKTGIKSNHWNYHTARNKKFESVSKSVTDDQSLSYKIGIIIQRSVLKKIRQKLIKRSKQHTDYKPNLENDWYVFRASWMDARLSGVDIILSTTAEHYINAKLEV